MTSVGRSRPRAESPARRLCPSRVEGSQVGKAQCPQSLVDLGAIANKLTLPYFDYKIHLVIRIGVSLKKYKTLQLLGVFLIRRKTPPSRPYSYQYAIV